VHDPFRNGELLVRQQLHDAVLQVDHHPAIDDEEELVFITGDGGAGE
jgi:hypothetical protein